MTKTILLESILFCPSELKSLNGQKVSLTAHFQNPLEGRPLPDLSEFSSALVRPQIDLAEVPLYFGTSPTNTFRPWPEFPGFDVLSHCIQYRFNDHSVFTAREILYHSYSNYVPKNLLPLLSNIPPELESNLWIRLLPDQDLPLWGKMRRTELALVSILNHLPQHPAIQLELADSSRRDLPRKTVYLKSVHLCKSPSAHWLLNSEPTDLAQANSGQASLQFKLKPNLDSLKVFQAFEIDPLKGVLTFHPYLRMIELVVQSFKFPEMRDTYSKWILDNNIDPCLCFELREHTQIAKFLGELDHKLTKGGFVPIQRKNSYTIPAERIRTEIWIAGEGSFKFCRKFEHHAQIFEIWNLPPIAATLLDGLNSGLSGISSAQNQFVPQDRRGIRRDRELKIVRHAGVFGFILLETTSYLLKKKTVDGKPIPDTTAFFAGLFSRLMHLLIEIEKKTGFVDLAPTPTLERFCSKNLVDFIQSWVNRLLSLGESSTDKVYLQAGEFCLENSDRVVLEILRAILLKAASASKGRCFLRPKLNAFSYFFGKKGATLNEKLGLLPVDAETRVQPLAQSYDVVSNWLSPSDIVHSFVPLRRTGIELLYNSLPLNQMNVQDLKPEFQLIEKEDKKTGHSIDWFELHPKFFFQGVEVTASTLERLSKEGLLEFQGKIYLIQNKNLPSVKRLEAFWAKIQSGGSSEIKKKEATATMRIPRSRVLEMLALRASGVAVHGGERWNQICAFYDSLSEGRTALSLPSTLKAELKPYQKTGVQWILDLYRLGLGGILADDMGLGKTIQTLAFLESLRTQDEMGSVLIVVPTSLTYSWMSEAARFTPQMPIQIFQSKTKPQIQQALSNPTSLVLIATYGLFTEHREFFESTQWNILIFDEAQNLKNVAAKRTTASRMIPARFKLCLTGTPLENHLGEFFSLLDLVVSGCLGDFSPFREKFITPETIDAGELKYLKLRAKPLLLRRTKSEILTELPPKVESTIKLPFEQKQEKIYRDIALSWNEKVKESILDQGEAKSQLLMLTALLRLRQACSDPGAIPHVKYSEEPPKVTVLMEALAEITESGESALVFTQFLHTFERIKKELTARKIRAFSLHGGTSRPDREKILKEFQESDHGTVLLMTLKTGGVGLNLIKASYVFHLEPWWNPAVENQASDRVHRLGQQKPVQIYRYLMKGSVEEKIEVLKERKSARFNALFSNTETDPEVSLGSSILTKTDFDYLLG